MAVKANDLPSGIQRCSQSGSIGQYLNNLKSGRPDQYATQSDEWKSLKSNGANDAWFEVYATNRDECNVVFGTGNKQVSNPKLVQNLVFRFKDQSSASKAYQNGIFGLNSTALQGQQGLKRGSSTGFGNNAVTVNTTLSSGVRIFLAFWQRDVFAVLFRADNLKDSDSQKAAQDVNSRI